MSRIGKLPISIPAGVTDTHKYDIVTVTGGRKVDNGREY